jgi:hypothetical protein
MASKKGRRKQKEEEEEGRKRRKGRTSIYAEPRASLANIKEWGSLEWGTESRGKGRRKWRGKGRNGGNEIKFTHRGVKKGKKCHVFFWTRGGEYAGHQHIPTTI